MSRRITVVVDDEVAESLDLLHGKSASARVNEVLRQAIAKERHRHAALAWIDAMDAELGSPPPADVDAANAILDSLGVPRRLAATA